jgi:hypothetical protein
MTRRVRVLLEVGGWLAALCGAVGTVVSGHGQSTPRASVLSELMAAPDRSPWAFDADSLQVWARHSAARDPFRLSRQPSLVGSESVDASTSVVSTSPPKPQLVLYGILGARARWQAVIGGVPGETGPVLVRSDDTLATVAGPFRVHHIAPDTILVQGMDTTWRLTLRHP